MQCWASKLCSIYCFRVIVEMPFSQKSAFLVASLRCYWKVSNFPKKKFYVLKREWIQTRGQNIKNSIFFSIFQGFRYWHHWNLLMPWSHRIGSFPHSKKDQKKHNTCSRVLAAQYLKMRSLCSMHTTTDFCTRNSKKERRELTTSNIKGFLSTWRQISSLRFFTCVSKPLKPYSVL